MKLKYREGAGSLPCPYRCGERGDEAGVFCVRDVLDHHAVVARRSGTTGQGLSANAKHGVVLGHMQSTIPQERSRFAAVVHIAVRTQWLHPQRAALDGRGSSSGSSELEQVPAEGQATAGRAQQGLLHRALRLHPGPGPPPDRRRAPRHAPDAPHRTFIMNILLTLNFFLYMYSILYSAFCQKPRSLAGEMRSN